MRVLVLTVVHVPTDARIHNRQIRALMRRGHDVVFGAPFTAYDVDPGRDVLPRDWIDLPRASGRSRAAAVRAARRVVSERQADVDLVLVHDPDLLAACVPVPSVPVVWDVHEDTAAALSDRPWVPARARRPVRAMVRTAERWAERNLHLILAEEGYRSRFLKPHVVVPNYPWLPDGVVTLGRDRVVYLGRVSVSRGARDLAEMSRQLRDVGVGVDVIGPVDPDVLDELRKAEATSGLRLHGYVPNEQALAMLEGALAGLSPLHDHPNYQHSLPTKVLEYQAHGLPVITTPLSQARQIVESSGSGVIVPFRSPAELASAVWTLRSAPERARRLGLAGRRAAEARYSFDRIADAFVDHLERLAGA